MEFESRRALRKPRSAVTVAAESEYDDVYHGLPGLQLYYEPPDETISLQELEEFGLERLKVLKLIEMTGITKVRSSDDYKKAVEKGLTDLGWDFMTKPCKKMESKGSSILQKCKDRISHFVLRLAFCRTDALRRWFIQQELDLFRYRFSHETNPDDIKAILAAHRLQYIPIGRDEKQRLREELCSSLFAMSLPKVDSMEFYKVSWLSVLDLVRSRKVYLENGWAYVPQSDIVSLVMDVYREHLKKVMAKAGLALPAIEGGDDRIRKAVVALSSGYVGEDFGNRKNAAAGEITAASIDTLAQESFPLCMRQLHQHLKSAHHMKNDGRQQYGLFLKAIGLPLDEALNFWRSNFAKGVTDPEKFDKNYAYSIRHNYGKEGKRTSYSAHGCTKIIMAPDPKGDECHGCPFKHSDQSLLKQRLEQMKLKKEDIDRVLELKKQGHYTVACMRLFEVQHGIAECNFALQHPNQYFEESQKLLHGDTSNRPRASHKAEATNSQSTTAQTNVAVDGLTQEDINSFEEEMTEMDAAAS